mmetsp:Transcript_9517/g.29507  ORF Transcript_9517/g.29507 Transcript_9517/m.29507 type:complete len:134 (+) Transcript_9517:2221-2622(+)
MSYICASSSERPWIKLTAPQPEPSTRTLGLRPASEPPLVAALVLTAAVAPVALLHPLAPLRRRLRPVLTAPQLCRHTPAMVPTTAMRAKLPLQGLGEARAAAPARGAATAGAELADLAGVGKAMLPTAKATGI